MLIKISSLLLMVGLSLSASDLYVNYLSQKASFDAGDLDLKGGIIGISGGDSVKFYLEGNFLNDSEKKVDFYEAVIGLRGDFLHENKFRFGYDVGVGIGQFDVSSFSNTNEVITVPIGVSASYEIIDNLIFSVGAGYKYFFDLTDNSTGGSGSYSICNDGTTSQSTGSGTCSWHGGVKTTVGAVSSSTQDVLGDGGGVSLRMGLGYKF